MATLWKVPNQAVLSRAAPGAAAARRLRISSAALFVKVSTTMSSRGTPLTVCS